ncbi:hypothetical protein WJX72_009745 [[Myrmecia] bisecta]|uniref:Uncharacterized protein n=1 Tax=[Myrmecia] bisecta TaxID=41462 RepID=A0AAW1R9K1_9CHLO
MRHFKVSAVLPIPAHLFFVERDSAAFRSLVAKVMKLGCLEIVEGWTKADGVEVYKLVTSPDLDKFVPKNLQHHLPGGSLKYTDIIEYDPRRIAQSPFKLKVTSIPPVFASRSTIKAELTIERETDTTCRQTLEGTVDIRIFALGKIAESIIASSLKDVYSGIPAIVERWVAFRNEVLKSPNGHEVLVHGRPKNTEVAWINDQIRDLLKADSADADAAPPALMLDTVSTDMLSEAGDRRMEVEEPGTPGREEAQPGTVAASRGLAAGDSAEDLAFADAKEKGIDRTDSVGRTALEVENEIFYDAREEWPWSEEEWKDDLVTLRQLESDHKAIVGMHRSFKKPKHQPEQVSWDASEDSSSSPDSSLHPGADAVERGAGSRFSRDFKRDFDAWTAFWEEHEVPADRRMPNLPARMGHFLGLAAGWGYLKPKSRKRHGHTASFGNISEGAGSQEGSQARSGSEGSADTTIVHAQAPDVATPSNTLKKEHSLSHSSGKQRPSSFLQRLTSCGCRQPAVRHESQVVT